MVRLIGLGLALTLLAALLTPAAVTSQEAEGGGEDFALKINGKAFSTEDFSAGLREEYGKIYRERFIVRYLVQQEAERAGVDGAAVDTRVEKELERALEHPRIQGDKAALERELSNRGLSVRVWKEYLRTTFLTEEILKKDLQVKDEDLTRSFEAKYGKDGRQWRVRHIQASVNVNASKDYTRKHYNEDRPALILEQTEAAKAALIRLQSGDSFEALVLDLSDDRATATKDRLGKLGTNWRFLGEDFEKIVVATAKGTVGGPVQSPQGVHLIEVIDIVPAEFELQHVLLATTTLNGLPEAEKEVRMEALRTKAEAILKEANEGKDFAELAKTYSEDPRTKDSGGALGRLRVPSRYGETFDKDVQQLEEGEIGGPIESRAGLHIVKLNKKTILPSIRHILFSTQFPQVRERKLRPILEKAAQVKIDRVLAMLAAGDKTFSDVAGVESEDRASQTRGGEITNYRPASWGEEFHAVVEAMKPGDPPRTAKSRRGLHVVEVIEVIETKLDDVREQLVGELKGRGVSRAEVQQWQDDIRAKAKVEVPGEPAPDSGDAPEDEGAADMPPKGGESPPPEKSDSA